MIIFDLETTGLDILNDRIIEIYALKVHGDLKTELHHIFNPEKHIPAETTYVNGFTDEMVKYKPKLSEHIKEIYEFFQREVLVGYNILNYDVLILAEEFSRSGYEFDLSNAKIVDLFSIWNKYETKNLKSALKRFCNEETEDLHSAKIDVEATFKIMDKMLTAFNLHELSLNELSGISNQSGKEICFGKLFYNDKNELVINFGKYKGISVKELYKKDVDYLRWIYKDMDDHLIKYYVTKEVMKIKNKDI